MTRASAHKAILAVRVRIIADDVNGIVIERSGTVSNNGNGWYLHWQGTWLQQKWRVQCGGGIAGNSDKWWIVPMFERDGEKARGPFTTQKTMIKALREWKRWESESEYWQQQVPAADK